MAAPSPDAGNYSDVLVSGASRLPGRLVAKLHVWLGSVAAAYILFISLSGCAVLFEQELYRFFSPAPQVEAAVGPRLGPDDLARIAVARYPGQRVVGIWDRKVSAALIAELWIEGRGELQRRLMHPFTGADLGDAYPMGLRVLAALREAHTNLLAGRAGRVINGLGSAALLLMSFTGAGAWLFRRERRIGSRQSPPTGTAQQLRRFHRRFGVWMLGFGMIWGATGLVFAFGYPLKTESIGEWLYAIHTGAVGGWLTKAIWAASSLLTAFLPIAGVSWWWPRAVQMPKRGA